MFNTLQDHLTAVQRLLHDAQGRFYTQSDLTLYINEARNKVALDTGCLRALQTATVQIVSCTGTASLGDYTVTAVSPTPDVSWTGASIQGTGVQGNAEVAGVSGSTLTMSLSASAAISSFTVNQETYPFSTFSPWGAQTFDIINMTLIWGNLRIPCFYLPWSDVNAYWRAWATYNYRPAVFSIYGQNQVTLLPVPSQPYFMEADTCYLPTALAALTDPEVMTYQYAELVQYYAASLAKLYSQRFDQAGVFEKMYTDKAKDSVCKYTRRLYTPYAQA